MENNMFCFQCQETAKGFGCTLKGVCGKNATTARTMDLLLFVVRGISVVADQLRQHSLPVEKEVDNFIVDALFCTITNANFDDESITKRIDKGLANPFISICRSVECPIFWITFWRIVC